MWIDKQAYDEEGRIYKNRKQRTWRAELTTHLFIRSGCHLVWLVM